MEKRQLAGGQITVWREGEGMIIDHANGLTIELTSAEMEALFEWMDEQVVEDDLGEEPIAPGDYRYYTPQTHSDL